METAVSLRRQAEAAVRAGRFAEASGAYRREAAIYRKNNDPNGAKVEEMKADRWASEVRLFAHRPNFRPAQTRSRLAKWEPPYGCYLGAFIDRDESLGQAFFDESFQAHQDPDRFERATGKAHASVFCYVAYGRPFPSKWVAWLESKGVAAHIAWEPNAGLAPVRDDAYLRGWARAAARSGSPLFLRFASEMNGGWTRYSGDPARYKGAWRTVQRVMADEAPNVAMVWCVNAIPEAPMAAFYPGDEYVDWVGVNFYSVPFHDNNPNRLGLWENPADNLRYVYNHYAARKPLMICEFGASRMARGDGIDRSGWAAQKIAELYASLPRLYPRVKMVDVFNMNNLKWAMPGRQLNDYSVTNSATVLRAYRDAIAPDYFLSDMRHTDDGVTGPTPIAPIPASGLTVGRGILRVSVWARCYADRYNVAYELNGSTIANIAAPGPRETVLRLDKPGLIRLAAVVRDDRNRIAARQEAPLRVTG